MRLQKVNDALLHICGGKAHDWLDNMDTKEDVIRIRRAILEDYSFNTFSLAGVNALKTVLSHMYGCVEAIELRDKLTADTTVCEECSYPDDQCTCRYM